MAWNKQLAGLIDSVLPSQGSLLEVGVGEATTLARVVQELGGKTRPAYGFDISWSRVSVANESLAERKQEAELFVADLFHIPLEDNSVDVVFSSHSLEPNGGHEKEAIAECLRVARVAVVLAEPIYELASPEARIRMERHGYVRNLKAVAEQLGANVLDYRLLEVAGNPLNLSGVLLLGKNVALANQERMDSIREKATQWRCPLTGVALVESDDLFFAAETGIAYPKLRDVPLLRPEHAVVASRLGVRQVGCSQTA